ncbi:uncharacterized protein [Pseudorca crassidens]|uniref:uncharacterized protein n=1 Tax=Pseudorca crassidens TaxID=82174 RepID=UPI00352F57F7
MFGARARSLVIIVIFLNSHARQGGCASPAQRHSSVNTAARSAGSGAPRPSVRPPLPHPPSTRDPERRPSSVRRLHAPRVRPSFLSWSPSPLCLEGVAGVCEERVVTHRAPAQLGGPSEDLGTMTSGPRRRCLPFQILQWGAQAFIPAAELPRLCASCQCIDRRVPSGVGHLGRARSLPPLRSPRSLRCTESGRTGCPGLGLGMRGLTPRAQRRHPLRPAGLSGGSKLVWPETFHRRGSPSNMATPANPTMTFCR